MVYPFRPPIEGEFPEIGVPIGTAYVKPVLNESKLVISISPRALRPPAAAMYLGCTPSLIEDLWRDGILPFRILGGQRVVDVQDLDKYFESLPKQTGLVSGRKKFMVAKAA